MVCTSPAPVVFVSTCLLEGVGKKKVAEKSAAAGQKANQVCLLSILVLGYGVDFRITRLLQRLKKPLETSSRMPRRNYASNFVR